MDCKIGPEQDHFTTELNTHEEIESFELGFGVFAWVAVLVGLLPIVIVNATRAMATIRAFSKSFASKELELRREKHKTEALLHEMLPRYTMQCNRPTLSWSKLMAARAGLKFCTI